MNFQNDLIFYERSFWACGELCAGIDEAGRGPLVGPVVCALVIFPSGYNNKDIYDSKALSAKKRRQLFYKIINEALFYDIEVIDARTIDRINILEASRLGMERLALRANCHNILTDAMKLDIDKKVIDLIKGDQRSISIAAASIIAKEYRDRMLEALGFLYPEYEFEKHKGYPTKKHLALLEKLPIIEDYRLTFGPIKNIYRKIS